MEIIVHGTKGGRKIFTPKKIGGLIDVTADRCLASAIGQEAFAIRFIDNSIIFSKYKIIRDVSGEKRTGFIAFSLFLSYNERLSGANLVSALNMISSEYCKRYIPDNDNNLNHVTEQWTFLDVIINHYKKDLTLLSLDDVQKMQSGIKDDGFIYYKNQEELEKYFNFPYQDIYSKFRQVLFVNVELKDKEQNPLNALRHSEENLTGKIDLDNPKYKLLFNLTTKEGARIDVKVNGITHKSKSRINRKDELEISWSKEFHKTIIIKGIIDEISKDYIEVCNKSDSIFIKEILLSEITKTITLNLKDWTGKELKNGTISCQSGDNKKNLNGSNHIIFTGQEISRKWYITATNNRIFSNPQIVDLTKDFIDIVLDRSEIKIKANDSDNGDLIPNIQINKNEFIAEELEKSHKIIVNHKDYEQHTFDYHPLESQINHHNHHVTLKKKQVPDKSITHSVATRVHEKNKEGNNHYSESKEGKDDKSKKAKKFYLKSEIKIAAIVTILFVFVIAVAIKLFPINSTGQENERTEITKPNPINYDSTRIINYIHGDELLIDTLNLFNIDVSRNNSLINIIDSAISFRSILDSKHIRLIKENLKFPSKNENIKKIREEIININNFDTAKVKEYLGDISSKSLYEITSSLSSYLNNINNKSKSEDSKKNKGSKQQNEIGDVQQLLKSASIERYKLNELIEKDQSKMNSIKLYSKFWELIENNNSKKSQYQDLMEKVKKDNVLGKSKLYDFLKKLCENDNMFDKLYIVEGRQNSTISIDYLNNVINSQK